jgi:hypothetical protein
VRELDAGPRGRWDVLVGRESWGGAVLLFASRDGAATRTVALDVGTVHDAERLLLALTDAELRERLAASVEWGGA